MDQHKTNIFKTSTARSAQEPSRGFKPVISIPIIVSAQNNYQKQSVPVKDINLPLDVRLNTFYQEYLRLIKENKLIKITIDHVNREKNQLREKLNSLQSAQGEENQGKKKRHRRNANEIQREYQCPISSCQKSYGAEASLTQHIKLKHKSFYGTPQFENFIQEINRRSQKMQKQ